MTEYNEVCSNFRTLTDIRFKLLAFLPIAAGVAVAVSKKSPYTLGLALPLFGLVATIGLATYNARNNQLYNELVGRAAAIERSLYIPDGAFANRPTAWLRITLLGRKWKIDHGTAISTIYAASIALWLFGVVAYVLEWCRRAYLAIGLPSISVKEPSAWVNTTAIVVAIVVTYLAVRALSSQQEIRQKNMRVSATKAMKRAIGIALLRPAKDQQSLIEECAENDKFIDICAELSESTTDKVRARAKFYASLEPDFLRDYIPPGPKEITASYLVALLTNLPPRYILDCWSNRRGYPELSKPLFKANEEAKNTKLIDALKRFLWLLRGGQLFAEENKALVRREQEELWNHTGNLDAAVDLYAAGQAEAAKKEAADYRRGFPDVANTIEDLIAEGDKVVARWRSRATHKGEYMGFPPTGKEVEVTGITLYRIEGSKIAESWNVEDKLGLLRQIGAFPEPEQSEEANPT